MDRTGLSYNSLTRPDLPMEDWRSTLMEKKIDLYNFESAGAQDCPYILTSPRSLRACARMKIQPMELLLKPESDFEEELLVAGKQPGEASRKMYDAHERQRLRKLYMCRRAREEIIQEEGGRENTGTIDHAQLLFQGMNKPPERTIKPTTNGIDPSKVIIPKNGQANSNLRPGALHSPTHPSNRSLPSSKPSTASSSMTSTPTSSTTKTSSVTSSSKTTSSSKMSSSSSKTGTTSSSSSSWTGRRHTTDGPPRSIQRSSSMPPTSRVRPQSATTPRTPLRERIKMDLERQSRPLRRPYSASASNLSERDQRILECMVFKREQELEEIKHQQVLHHAWQEERERDEKIRMENELQRRRSLVEKEHDRLKKRERMHRQRDKEEKKKLKEAEVSIKYKDEKHKLLASQQDLLRINQIENRKHAEKLRKDKQEKLFKEKEAKDEEYRRQVERHIALSLDVAEAKRHQKQHQEVKELQKKNKTVMKQHAERKKEIDKKTEQENENKRLNIDIKDIIHRDMIDKQHLQRQSELRNSRRKLEQQQKKTLKTKTEIDGKLDKWRDEISKHRSVAQEQAAVKAEKVVQEKAHKAQELRVVKEKTHKQRIARVAEDVEKMARYTEEKIKQKDRKVEEVKSKKQQEIDRSRAVAQSSAKLREQIRQQYTRTFDRMAQKAELECKLGAGPQFGTKNFSHEYIIS